MLEFNEGGALVLHPRFLKQRLNIVFIHADRSASSPEAMVRQPTFGTQGVDQRDAAFELVGHFINGEKRHGLPPLVVASYCRYDARRRALSSGGPAVRSLAPQLVQLLLQQ